MYAVPRVSLLLPTRIWRIAPNLPNKAYICRVGRAGRGLEMVVVVGGCGGRAGGRSAAVGRAAVPPHSLHASSSCPSQPAWCAHLLCGDVEGQVAHVQHPASGRRGDGGAAATAAAACPRSAAAARARSDRALQHSTPDCISRPGQQEAPSRARLTCSLLAAGAACAAALARLPT